MLEQVERPVAEIEDRKNERKKNSGDDVDSFRPRRKFLGQPSRHSPPALTEVQTESFQPAFRSLKAGQLFRRSRNSGQI